MIPSYFVLLDKIPLTPNGKIDRKALPAPGIMGKDEYTAPGDEIEVRLVEIWSEVLGIERDILGIDANFFELGGHSLKVTIMVSKIHQSLNVKIPLAEVFRWPRIRELARYIKTVTKDKHASIEPVEKREYYALSSAQQRLYFLQQLDPESTGYNMPLILPLDKVKEKDKLEATLKQLIARHESLRTSFERVNEVPVQRIHEGAAHPPYKGVEFKIEYYDASQVKVKVDDYEGTGGLAPLPIESAESTIKNFIRPFDLSQAPLIRSGLIGLPEGSYTWIVDMHHIISDGTSHMILAEDFMSLYHGEELEPLKLQYKDFSQWQNRLFESGAIDLQERYWLELYADAREIPRLDLPNDFKRPEVFTFKGNRYDFKLEKEDAIKFKALGTRNNGTLYMNILAALNTLFYRYTDQSDIIIGTGVAGRPHVDLQLIMGMFVNTLPIRNYPAGGQTYESFLREVIAHSVKAFENQDVQFEELVDLLEVERNSSRNPLFDISMVVQNFRRLGEGGSSRENAGQIESLPIADENLPFIDYENLTTKFDMTFFVFERGEDVHITIEYYTGIFKEETVKRLAMHLKNIVKTVGEEPSIKLKDIEMISGVEKQQLLHEWNDTVVPYPFHKTIHQLFEEQVEKTPDNVALIGQIPPLPAPGAVTYQLLNETSNQLANYISKEKNIRPQDRVGILMSPSLYRLIAVLGILKAGGAYVPIDPLSPYERIKYIIKDAGIGVVISEKKYNRDLNRLQWECKDFRTYLCMDSNNIYKEDENEKNELMDRELWHHVGETASDEITGGGWTSSYTGEPFSKQEMDEYGDNILKKVEPLLHPRMRVLEIGCASGISMYRIAPKVALYYGTDLSNVIIAKNKKRVQKEAHHNIKLSCLAAHEIDQIEENSFDMVIINSVVQCFHGHNYLRQVLGKAVDLLGEEGYLFIGDIMDQDKKESLVGELARFKKAPSHKNYTTKTDFSSELFLSRGFWTDLGVEFDEIQSIEFSDKIYTIENELTKFRYDVLIKIDKTSAFRVWFGITGYKLALHESGIRYLYLRFHRETKRRFG
jgi:acyl carrier protein/SAM-dependent methyltransferase